MNTFNLNLNSIYKTAIVERYMTETLTLLQEFQALL